MAKDNFWSIAEQVADDSYNESLEYEQRKKERLKELNVTLGSTIGDMHNDLWHILAGRIDADSINITKSDQEGDKPIFTLDPAGTMTLGTYNNLRDCYEEWYNAFKTKIEGEWR